MRVGRDGIRTSERYVSAVGRWRRFIVTEPNALLAGSAWFILSCLPIVTLGPAWLALSHYMEMRESGVKTTWRESWAFACHRCGARSWLMGFSDLLAAGLAVGSFLGLNQVELPIPLRAIYAMMFMLDALYLMCAIYRYPALCKEPDQSVVAIMTRGVLMALSDLGWTLMFACVQLLSLIVCALTGVGLFILFPAVSALICACAYHEMAKQYAPPVEE